MFLILLIIQNNHLIIYQLQTYIQSIDETIFDFREPVKNTCMSPL